MSNIAIQRDSGKQPPLPARAVTRAWDPFRGMLDLARWEPFAELGTTFGPLADAAFSPDFEVKETKDAFLFRADVPGVKDTDLDVKLTQNRLSISGKRESEKSEKGDTYYTSERSYGSFTRSFTLPDGVDADHIRAELKEGVLTLSIPKRPESQPKKIAVTNK